MRWNVNASIQSHIAHSKKPLNLQKQFLIFLLSNSSFPRRPISSYSFPFTYPFPFHTFSHSLVDSFRTSFNRFEQMCVCVSKSKCAYTDIVFVL